MEGPSLMEEPISIKGIISMEGSSSTEVTKIYGGVQILWRDQVLRRGSSSMEGSKSNGGVQV
jgi:hypothetical protein